MIARIALMFVVVATLCCAAFSLGSKSSRGKQDATGIPPEHPVMVALHYQRELGLSADQIQKVTALHDALGKEFAPLRAKAESIQHAMQDVQQSAKPDPATVKKLQQESGALSETIRPLFDSYAQEVAKLLTDEQRQKLMKFSSDSGHPSDDHTFVLDTMMQSRDQLGITPQQFTKLQYLLADFIRAFAPVREKMELLQLEVQDKFQKEGKPPAPDFVQRGEDLKKQIAALQSQFSDQAEKEVLNPEQRTKFEGLLHEEHRSAPNGG
jgi:Spy/CpxP family protein refolding chaperone